MVLDLVNSQLTRNSWIPVVPELGVGGPGLVARAGLAVGPQRTALWAAVGFLPSGHLYVVRGSSRGRSGSLDQCMRLLRCISGFPRGHPTWAPSCCLLLSFEPSWLVAGSGEPTHGSMDIEATPWWGSALRVLQVQVDAQTPGTLVAKFGWRARDRAQLLRGRASPQGRGTFSLRPHARWLLGQGPTRGLPSTESLCAASPRDGFQGAGLSGATVPTDTSARVTRGRLESHPRS